MNKVGLVNLQLLRALPNKLYRYGNTWNIYCDTINDAIPNIMTWNPQDCLPVNLNNKPIMRQIRGRITAKLIRGISIGDIFDKFRINLGIINPLPHILWKNTRRRMTTMVNLKNRPHL